MRVVSTPSLLITSFNSHAFIEFKNMSIQTTEQKKEEFRKYLEKNGVIDQLTKVLVGLYEEPEKPPNVSEFIKKQLGAPSDMDVEALMHENESSYPVCF